MEEPIFSTMSTTSPINSKGVGALCGLQLFGVWTIWQQRNNVVFYSGSINSEKVLDLIKFRSWKWLRWKKKEFYCSFYDWKSNPSICLEKELHGFVKHLHEDHVLWLRLKVLSRFGKIRVGSFTEARLCSLALSSNKCNGGKVQSAWGLL